MADETDPVRVGMVGAGLIAARHADNLASFPDAALTAVVDPQADRAEAFAADTGARAYGTIAEMTEREQLDALYICVPPFAHGEPETAAVEAGLPVFVEKPLAADWATAAEIGALMASAGLVTGTGYHWRCLDTVGEARERLGERPPGLVAGRWFGMVPPAPWWVRRSQSGGQFIEQVTHVIDLARCMVGEVQSVFAMGGHCGVCRPDGDIDETSVATVRFASGAVGSFTATCLCGRKQGVGLEIVAPDLTLEIGETHLAVHEPDGTTIRRAHVDPRVQVDREFVDTVRGSRPSTRVPYDEALRTHRVACALADSSDTGQPVDLD
jgi:predicted dehydrogenase